MLDYTRYTDEALLLLPSLLLLLRLLARQFCILSLARFLSFLRLGWITILSGRELRRACSRWYDGLEVMGTEVERQLLWKASG